MLMWKLEKNWLLLSVRMGQIIGMFPFTVTSGNGDIIEAKVLLQKEKKSATPSGGWLLKYSAVLFTWCLFTICTNLMYMIVYYGHIDIQFVVNIILSLIYVSYIFGTLAAPFQATQYIRLFRNLSKMQTKSEKLPNKVFIFDNLMRFFTFVILVSYSFLTWVMTAIPVIPNLIINVWMMIKFFFGILNEMLLMRGTTVVLINELRRIRLIVDCSNNEESAVITKEIKQVAFLKFK